MSVRPLSQLCAAIAALWFALITPQAWCAGARLDNTLCDMSSRTGEGDGPYDYRSSDAHARMRRAQVEGNHFNLDVRTLKRGQTGSLGSDIDFLLRYVPNHREALKAISDLASRSKAEQPDGAGKTVTCYFEYAKAFAPDDQTVRILYGVYLLKNGGTQRGLTELEEAVRLRPEDMNAQYNLGLAYADMKEYDKAIEHAKAAYALGHPLPGLRDRLKRAGKWVD